MSSVGLGGERLEKYLGSSHSAVGLLLVWFGLPAIGGGILALSTPEQFPWWSGPVLLVWGMVSIPLGFSMRLRKPARLRWVLANLMLGCAFLVIASVILAGK